MEGYSRVIFSIVFGTIIVVATAGNLLVCVALVTGRWVSFIYITYTSILRLFITIVVADRRLRKAANLLLLSLAISDLLLSISVMPIAAANDILGYWPFIGMKIRQES